MEMKAVSVLCVLTCAFAINGFAAADEPTAEAKVEKPGIWRSKDPRAFGTAFSLLFHAKSDINRRSSIADAKMIFASADGEKPFEILGADEKYTAVGVMEKLTVLYGGEVRSAIVVGVEKEGVEKELLEPLMKHAETFDIDVYRFGPVRKEHLVKAPFELEKPSVNDPRFIIPSLTLMWPGMDNGKRDRRSLKDALMIYSTVQGKHHILGVDREFSKEQIIKGLDDFYKAWKPKEAGPSQPPAIILGAENWGAGADLYETLQRLAKDGGVDIYLNYVCNYANYPTSTENDKRLAELIR